MPDFETDKRGVIVPEQQAAFRSSRAAEQWERYDTIVIGPGAATLDAGWFNSWAALSATPLLLWFNGRAPGVGKSYTNQMGERLDYAQDIYQTTVELIPPVGLGDIESDANDAAIMPVLFMQELANCLALTVKLAETDDIALAPASHFPSGYGTAFPMIGGAAAPTVIAGTNGLPYVKNSWIWPEPILLAAKSKITVEGVIDAPLRQALATLPGPGNKLVPNGAGGQVTIPNFYRIRITHRGPRYLQLRGARSSA